MATPAGVFLLGLVGLIVAAIGIAFIFRGITRAFKKHLVLPSGAGDTGVEEAAKDGARTGIVAFGVVGYIAKGIAIGVTGILFIVAAFTHDPETAGGLDAALHSLARTAVRAGHPLDRGSRPDPLRPLLLRSRPLRADVTRGCR